MEKLLAKIRSDREWFRSGSRAGIAERRRMLSSLLALIKSNRDYLFAALNTDLGKPEYEAFSCEYVPVTEALKYQIKHLKKFASPHRAGGGIFNFPSSASVCAEPYGAALIFGTWNYPLLLAVDPVAGALAAGNRVTLVLSSQSPETARVLKRIFREWEYSEWVNAVEEDEIKRSELLAERFDVMFFTGGAAAAADVAAAAAANFTPVMLELGGKSPVIVDADADLKVAARRIVWGKFTNAGQTCVAPDYLLVHRAVREKLLNHIRAAVKEFYGDDPSQSPDYGRIVNMRHYERLCRLLSGGNLVCGGEKEPSIRYIAPTVLSDVAPESEIMEREIFGPILPVIEVSGLDDAVAVVNRREKPLALYYFGGKRSNFEKVAAMTSSGGACFNEVLMHLMSPALPFGGVGASGMGCYHGRYSFDAFSHYKPCLRKRTFPDWKLRYPPYSGLMTSLLKKFF